MSKDIYKMRLHEQLRITDHLYIRRVPGGWIYTEYNPNSEAENAVFVPFDNGFQSREPTCKGE
jgi:hypothetical protein